MTTTTRSLLIGALLAFTAGCSPKAEDPLPPPPAASITSFTVSPTSVAKPGDAVTLTWETANATSVSVEQVGTGAVSGATDLSGTASVTVSADTIFVLTARGEGGTDARSVGVTVGEQAGDVLFTALPARITAGQSATLAWYAPGAQSVGLAAVGGAAVDIGTQKENGTVTVTPDATTTYRLTVDGKTSDATVAVTPVIEAFALEGSAPAVGDPAKLTWKTRGATQVTLTRAGEANPLVTEMDPARVANGDFTDTVPPSLPPSGLLRYTLTASVGMEQVTQQLEIRVAAGLRFTGWTIPAYGRLGGGVSVTWKTTGADSVHVEVDGQTTYVTPTAVDVASGTTVVDVPPTTATVKLIATNVYGERAEVTGMLEPVGAITFNSLTATPSTTATGGDAVTLAWDVSNARRLRLTQVGGGFAAFRQGTVDTGSVTVRPNAPTVTYQLDADNRAGDAIDTQFVTVTVTAPTVVTVSRKLPSGGATTIDGTTVPGATTIYGAPTADTNATGAAFVDIAATGTEITGFATTTGTLNSNDGTALIDVPGMDLRIFGVPVSSSQVSVSTNGWFYFSSANNATTNPSVPVGTSLQPLSIVPFGQNLDLGATGRVYWQQDQVNGVDRLIIQWTHAQTSGNASSDITFQAQVYATGEIVFAYQTIQGVTASWSCGVVNGNESAYLAPTALPAEGDTVKFFAGQPVSALPVAHTVLASDYWLTVEGTGGALVPARLDDRMVTGNIAISEINPRPAAGLTDAEWIELTNTTGTAIDLEGWSLAVGTATYTFPAGVTVPANGRLLMAQAADLGDGATVTVGHLYPNTFLLPDTSGTLNLRPPGSTTAFARFDWNAATAPAAGRSVQADPPSATFKLASPFSTATCPAPTTATYGTSLQQGTPGAAQPKCFPYTLEALPPNGFQSIAASGTTLVLATNLTTFTTYQVTLPQAVRYFGNTSTNLSVCSAGWLSTTTTTSTNTTNKTLPNTTAPVGAIAPFWDYNAADTALPTNGLYWEQRDPDMTPGSGDELTIVSWEGFRYSSTSYAGQYADWQVLFHGNGDIDFQYGKQVGTTTYLKGLSATSWLENPAGTAAMFINVNSTTAPGITPFTGFRYRYTP